MPSVPRLTVPVPDQVPLYPNSRSSATVTVPFAMSSVPFAAELPSPPMTSLSATLNVAPFVTTTRASDNMPIIMKHPPPVLVLLTVPPQISSVVRFAEASRPRKKYLATDSEPPL